MDVISHRKASEALEEAKNKRVVMDLSDFLITGENSEKLNDLLEIVVGTIFLVSNSPGSVYQCNLGPDPGTFNYDPFLKIDKGYNPFEIVVGSRIYENTSTPYFCIMSGNIACIPVFVQYGPVSDANESRDGLLAFSGSVMAKIGDALVDVKMCFERTDIKNGTLYVKTTIIPLAS